MSMAQLRSATRRTALNRGDQVVTCATKALKKAAPPKKAGLKLPSFGTKKATVAKKAAPKKGKPSPSTPDRDLWLPNAKPPVWLDGSMVGDRGFDPLGLAKPAEFVQYDVDALDQNKGVNKRGGAIGTYKPLPTQVSTDSLQPYNEVFSIQRFRECEIVHCRWAMLAVTGVVTAEAFTGVSWIDAGKEELLQAQYLGFELPFSVTQLTWIEVLLVGGAEFLRNSELDLDKRCYPGGNFDPLGLAKDDATAARLKEAEIRHSRLAMIAALGIGIQSLATRESPLANWYYFSDGFN